MVEQVPTVQVIYNPAHETAGEVNRDTAVLEWAGHVEGAPCWRLFYLEPDGNGVEDYLVVGDITDVDRAVSQADAHLLRVYRGAS